MCSTSISSGTAGDGGSGDSHQSLGSKKTTTKKKQRVPKRGPGVAELEKILRQQQSRQPSSTTVSAAAAAAVTFSPPPPTTATRTLFSIPSPPRSQLYTLLSHPTTSFPGEGSSISNSRSAFQFPFNNGASSDLHQMQRIHQPSFPTMMNFFPSSSSSSVEPPSNQIRPFPDKPSGMIGGKRQCPFYIGDNTVAAETPSSFRFQAPSYLPSFSPRMNHDTDSRGNLVLLGCPTTTRDQHSMFYNPPPPMQQRSVEGYEGFKNKPPPFLYSFLEEAGISSKVELDGEEEGDGIDLRLKL